MNLLSYWLATAKSESGVRVQLLKWQLSTFTEKVAMGLAWRLPRQLVYWCGIRMISHATAVLPVKELDAITPADVLKAWEQRP